MGFDASIMLDSIKEGTREIAETSHEKVSEFHENYVSEIMPEFGKYGDVAKFAAEMIPGVSEYNAIKEGDWQAFAIAAGIDIAALAIGVGGFMAAKTALKTATKEVAEAGTKKIAKEVVEAGTKKVAKETAEAGAEKISKEVVEAGAEKIAKETIEAGAEKAVKETAEAGTEKLAKDVAEAGAVKVAKEVAEAGTEKATKEAVEAGAEKAVLKVGDKIDKTRFPEYLDEIEKITGREIMPKQKELLENALRENDYLKLNKDATKVARNEFNTNKVSLIEQWQQMTGKEWPRYVEDVLDEAGNVIRRAGDRFDAHHIIELSTGGPNEWWNLHPAGFPDQHQGGIHAAGSIANAIFG